MLDLTPDTLAVFRRQHGMATPGQLGSAGMGRRARSIAVGLGVFEALYHGRVLHLASAPLTLEARCAALSLAYPTGGITGPTAGRLRAVRRMPPTTDLHYLVPHGSHIGPFDGVVLHQTTVLPASHLHRRTDGITIVTDARLAFDLASFLEPLDHRSALEHLRKKGTTLTQLRRIARELVHQARPGSPRFVATLLSLGGPPAESHPEVVIADGLRRRGVAVEAQVRPMLNVGPVRFRVDLAMPSVRWGVEIDIHPDHLLLDGTTKDKRRDRKCHLVDWQIERVTEIDLIDVEGLCDELATLYEARRWALARRSA